MVRNSELNQLRAQVRAEHRRANAKASRLRAKGVEVAGTKFDPRRNLGNVKRYTKAQLESYSRQLTAFTSRRNGFEAGREGAPIPAATARAYRQAERKYNRVASREYSRVANIALPSRGMTISEADRLDRPTRRTRAGGEAVTRPLDPVSRSLSNVTGARQLDRLRRQLEKKSAPEFKPKAIRAQRAQFMQMLTDIGNTEHIKSAKKLTDEQFNVLFNYHTELVNDISMDYEFTKLRAAGTQEEYQERIHESATKRIGNTLQWAGTLKF